MTFPLKQIKERMVQVMVAVLIKLHKCAAFKLVFQAMI